MHGSNEGEGGLLLYVCYTCLVVGLVLNVFCVVRRRHAAGIAGRLFPPHHTAVGHAIKLNVEGMVSCFVLGVGTKCQIGII